MRERIIGLSIIALLAILYAQSTGAQAVPGVTVYAWTVKSQYKPGETGTLKITVLNERDAPVEVRTILIMYPWFVYNGQTEKWEGNATIAEGLPKWVNPGEVYYTEEEFTIPTDGRVDAAGTIDIRVETGDGLASEDVLLRVSTTSVPMLIENLDTWMTSLAITLVVCTIVLAIVVLLATRRVGASRNLVSSAPPTPRPRAPSKPKTKA